MTNKDEKEEKGKIKKHNITVTPVGIAFPDNYPDNPNSLTAVSGSIYSAVSDLRSTFDVRQQNIAQTHNLDQNINYLRDIAESMKKTVDMAKKQRDDAIEDAKTERKRFYITLGITVILGIVAIIVGIMAL